MIPIYKGRRRQRGYGVGGNFASFFRAAAPLLKTAGMTVGKEALRAGNEVLDDIEKGNRNWKDSVKIHGKRAAINTLEIKLGAEHGSRKIKDIFSVDEVIQPSAKRRKASPTDSYDDIFSD